MHHFDCLHMIR